MYVYLYTFTRARVFCLFHSLTPHLCGCYGCCFCCCYNKSSKHKIRKHSTGEQLFTTFRGKCYMNAIPADLFDEHTRNMILSISLRIYKWAIERGWVRRRTGAKNTRTARNNIKLLHISAARARRTSTVWKFQQQHNHHWTKTFPLNV